MNSGFPVVESNMGTSPSVQTYDVCLVGPEDVG